MPALDALDVAVKALAKRDLTEREIVDRLTRHGVPEHSRADVVARLRQAGYLDDAKVAAERAARLAERGSGDAAIRAEVAKGCRWLGVELDKARNARCEGRISVDTSRISALVVPTDEERMIARQTSAVLGF